MMLMIESEHSATAKVILRVVSRDGSFLFGSCKYMGSIRTGTSRGDFFNITEVDLTIILFNALNFYTRLTSDGSSHK